MPCKNDVEKAILDKVFDELTDRRNTFTRTMDDTVQINGVVDNSKTKATRRDISKAIAKELVNRTTKSFNGHVKSYITDRSLYDPITVTFKVNPEYVNYEYNKLPIKNNNEVSYSPELNSEEERGNVNNNTGPNTRNNSDNTIIAGITEKYMQFKRQELEYYKNKLDDIKRKKNIVNITKEALENLNKKQRDLNLMLDGNKELGIVGIRNEIKDMKGDNVRAVSYYMEKDLDRLEKLSKSNNENDIKEANRVIEFIKGAGTFDRDDNNPFFNEDEVFLKDQDGELTSDYLLDDRTRSAFSQWAAKAVGYKNKVDERERELLEMNVNGNTLTKSTYGDPRFKYREIMHSEDGLRDADWFSMYLLDPTHGLFSNNGILPSIALSNLIESTESKERWSRDMDDWLNNNESDIKKELIKLGHDTDHLGILGIKAASFNLFKQITREGNETHNLVQRETKEYTDAKSTALYIFQQAFNKASTYKDYENSQKAYNRAFEGLKKWRRENSIMLDPSRLEDVDYKKEIVGMVGEKGFKSMVDEQERNQTNYESYRQGTVERLLVMENKNTYDELSDNAKNGVRAWEASYDPKKGYEDFNSVKGIFFGDKKWGNYMNYNTFIPRKYVADITANIKEDKYEIKNTNKETGHWDASYEKIQANPTLSNFYDKIKEFCEVMYENMPYDLQEKTGIYSLPGLMKTTAEIVNSNTETTNMLSRIGKAYQAIMNRFRTSFGVVKQGNISYAIKDPITGKSNYKVNDGFLRHNSRAIDDRNLIERTKFLQAFNSNRLEAPLTGIKQSTSLLLSQLNPSSLIQVAQYLHANVTLDQIEAGNTGAIKAKLDKTIDGKDYIVDIGRLINDFSTHSVVQSQSFDLPKLMRYFSEMTMAYAARNEALPINEILKKHYSRIQAPDTNNVGETIWNKISGKKGQEVAKVGIRTGANRQFDDWFDRVMLNNYSNKHIGVFGKENNVDGSIPLVGKTIYTTEQRKEYNELQKLITNEKDEKVKSSLITARDKLGKTRTATAALDNFLNWIRTLRLGYNLSSMATNFLEGVTSNMILGASDEYFDPKEIFYGYRVIKWSFAKNITFGYLEHPLAKKNRSLTEKFNVIIDSRNELQKSMSSKILDAANPYAGNQRVEYINQSPIMIAMLRTLKIKDTEGNESSVWDAYNPDGHLKTEFQTPENIENWEALEGEQYQAFKQKLEGLIILGHGNYHDLRGMMAKSSSLGKMGMMFKTWLPEAVYWRLANKQDNIFLGKQGTKGIYRSYGAGTGAVHGAAVGAAMFGPLGAIVGGGIGALAAGIGGTDSGVSFLKESIEATRLLVKKSLGIPINLIVGKQIINLHNKQFFGKGQYFDYVGKSAKFTAQDTKNLQANMADIAMQLIWLGLILATKHFFWDDNDKPNDPERIAHNILMNKLMQLGSQASMYTNPVAFKSNTIESVAVIDYLKSVSKEVDDVQKWFNGQDIVQSGTGAGKSATWAQTKKILLPGFFKDNLLGFKSMGQSVYPAESPYHKYFHNKDFEDKDQNKRQRAEKKADISGTDEYKDMEDLDGDALKEKKKELKKQLDAEAPTLNIIKKQQDKEK